MPACRPELIEAFARRLRSELDVLNGAPWWRRWSYFSRAALGQVLRKRD